MPYGKTQAEWNALSQAERSSLASGGGGGTASQQANRLAAGSGDPTRFTSSGSSQVLGGPRTAPTLSSLLGVSGGGGVGGTAGVGGGTPAQQYVTARGGAAPPVGPVGGGGTTGAGSGGGFTPPQVIQSNFQQNPYIAQLMQNQQTLFNTPFDREKERSMTRREQSLSLNEARQLGAQGGRGGLWGSQQQQIVNNQQQALAGQEAGFSDRETAARLGVLQAGAGIAGEGTRDFSAQAQAAQALHELNQRAALAERDYAFKYDELGVRARQNQNDTIFRLLSALA